MFDWKSRGKEKGRGDLLGARGSCWEPGRISRQFVVAEAGAVELAGGGPGHVEEEFWKRPRESEGGVGG